MLQGRKSKASPLQISRSTDQTRNKEDNTTDKDFAMNQGNKRDEKLRELITNAWQVCCDQLIKTK